MKFKLVNWDKPQPLCKLVPKHIHIFTLICYIILYLHTYIYVRVCTYLPQIDLTFSHLTEIRKSGQNVVALRQYLMADNWTNLVNLCLGQAGEEVDRKSTLK